MMIRNLKTLGILLAAVSALSAVGAPAASANFTAGSTTGNSTGVQTAQHVFTTNAGTTTCATAHFAGTWVAANSTSATVTPKYENCKAFGFVSVPIDINGCSFEFTTNEGGEVHLLCPTGKAIEITTPGCTTAIGPQTRKVNIFTNTTNPATGKMDVLVHSDITNAITYNECGTVRSNGSYTGTTTVSGTDTSGAAVDLTGSM
jgi:hypothetical protein